MNKNITKELEEKPEDLNIGVEEDVPTGEQIG